MATAKFFNGKIIKLPGAYSEIKSQAPAVFTSSTYSKALIVNVNPNLSFGGAVRGELTKGADALYRLRSLSEAQAFLKSGQLWQITQPLFIPSRLENTNGISELYYINALETKAPTITPTLENGQLVIKCKDEGLTSNGVATDGKLDSGYGLSIESGTRDSSKYILKFWYGTFKGMYKDGVPYDGLQAVDARPELVWASPEVATVEEFVTAATEDELFNYGFVVANSTDGSFTTADKTNNTLVLATGGTASYSTTILQETLELLVKTDFNVLISLNPVDAAGADVINARLQYFVQSETKFPKYLAVPGKSTGSASDLTANIEAAKNFNSERVWLFNGTPRKNASYVPEKYREYDSIYLTALIVGRIIGLPPQVPITFKDLDIDGLSGGLSELQKGDSLDAGVLAVHYDEDLEYFCVIRGINTLQKNTTLQNVDGSTFSIQISRICAQLNADLTSNAKREVFSTNTGANAFTVSPKFMENWTKSFLQSKVATSTQDNLILSYKDVSTERQGDALYTTYKFETNTEIAFMFFTAFAVN